MFEDYIEDSYNLALEARKAGGEKAAKRYYRAAVFCAVGAMEAFVNFVGETLEKGGKTEKYEIAFITDRKFGIEGDRFKVLRQMEFRRLDEKLRFLLRKYAQGYSISGDASWPQFIEFKRFRDSLVHPRKDEDETTLGEYDSRIKVGLNATIEIVNSLCKGLFGRNLRKKVVELTL